MAAIRTEVTKVGGTLLTGKGVREISEVLDLFDILIWVWFYKYTHIGMQPLEMNSEHFLSNLSYHCKLHDVGKVSKSMLLS